MINKSIIDSNILLKLICINKNFIKYLDEKYVLINDIIYLYYNSEI